MTEPDPATPVTRPGRDVVPFGQAVRAWFAISLQTFGGPAGQIAVMQRTLMERPALDAWTLAGLVLQGW